MLQIKRHEPQRYELIYQGNNMISFFNEDIQFDLSNKRLIKRWLNVLSNNNNYHISNLNYIFCSDKYLLDINLKYLKHDYYTDIITFDNKESDDDDNLVVGDIYISIDTIMLNGVTYGEGFERELHRVMAHGLLHLTGFDDVSDELQKVMTQQENIALDLLDVMQKEVGVNI